MIERPSSILQSISDISLKYCLTSLGITSKWDAAFTFKEFKDFYENENIKHVTG